ncbi:MAG: acyltransferase [Planctomycetota bacterium]
MAEKNAMSLRRHIPALDGVRGLAILMVLVAHFIDEGLLKTFFPVAGPIYTKLALAGLTGVQLFFVLSGFLITGILLDYKEREGYFRNFYGRRVLRIFPLYYTTLFAVFVVVPQVVQFDPAAQRIGSEQWRLWCYLGNTRGVVGWDDSRLFAVGHFWSLAVEEHFYLVWPFVVKWLSADRLKKLCMRWTAISFGVGLTGALYHSLGGPPIWILKWSTITQSGALTLGALAAVTAREPWGVYRLRSWARVWVVPLGACFLCLTLVPRRVWPDVRLACLIGVSVVLYVAILGVAVSSDARSAVSRIFCFPALTYLGKISYGLYVFHGLLRPAIRSAFPTAEAVVVMNSPLLAFAAYEAFAIGCSALIATASWYGFEKPILGLKRFFEYNRAAAGKAAQAQDQRSLTMREPVS